MAASGLSAWNINRGPCRSILSLYTLPFSLQSHILLSITVIAVLVPLFSHHLRLSFHLHGFTHPSTLREHPRIASSPSILDRNTVNPSAHQHFQAPSHQSTMSSSSSYSSYAYGKDAYSSRPSTASTSHSTVSSSSLYAQSSTTRKQRYSSKPPVIHNGGGQSNDPNTSTSAPHAGYYQ